MLKLTKGHNCNLCYKCEDHLPGIIEALNKKPMEFNPINPHIEWHEISNALKVCESGALQLDKVEKNV